MYGMQIDLVDVSLHGLGNIFYKEILMWIYCWNRLGRTLLRKGIVTSFCRPQLISAISKCQVWNSSLIISDSPLLFSFSSTWVFNFTQDLIQDHAKLGHRSKNYLMHWLFSILETGLWKTSACYIFAQNAATSTSHIGKTWSCTQKESLWMTCALPNLVIIFPWQNTSGQV